ncbi:hypothetical protein [Actinomadura sp. HBU206391]|uniref:Tc toxin subunit A-related protein n=1 Tax=Actinomadura sp. HBU206391 TaxID=2731692 RepID=UPI0016500BB4|nr:hypothetical protein [Actinomadura sp. HBU206391]MBC6461715.1 hypothetical protein [Actinomadura sp. HBU206391]
MAVPGYMAERRYSCRIAPHSPPASAVYEVETPESGFEQDVYDLFLKGEEHLHHEEYGLALGAFEELQLLILNTAHPELPVDPNVVGLGLPHDLELVDILAEQAGAMLQATTPRDYAFPPSLIADSSKLPAGMRRRLEPVTRSGLIVTSFHDAILTRLGLAGVEATAERWDAALQHYETALKSAPQDEPLVRGVLLHDMAVLADKADDHDRAVALGTDSLELLERGGSVEAQVRALDTMAGVYRRGGEAELAGQSAEKADHLRATHNLAPIVVARTSTGAGIAWTPVTRTPGPERHPGRGPAGATPGRGSARSGAAQISSASSDDAMLVAARYVAAAEPTKSYVVQNVHDRVELELDGTGMRRLLELVAATSDLAVVTGFAATPTQMVAYLPHMYFFVVPMAIGDCLAGLGNLEEAERTYLGILSYPYLNLVYEAVELWTKLAGVYVAMGDAAYRAARDTTTAFAGAKAHYERVVRTDGTLDAKSPLYADASFTGVKGRVEALLATDAAKVEEDPELATRVLGAKAKLDQIAAGLNFFGLAPGYLAPFGWEYLQSTARYFAQSASQIEQRYILFKSTAENQELQRTQLDQQADVAAEAVVLEQRGLAEAQAGVDVAQAGLDYAEVQLAGAIQAADDFDDVRWALLQLAQAEAWAAYPIGVDLIMVFLLTQRTLISQEMEAARLDRVVAEAEAAMDIAAAQLAQAQARVTVAEQRIAIAGLQQTYAEENRDHLDMREFSARLWFDLAAQAGALTRRYLDLAIEIALLVERAYNAETERGLQLIRYDYTDAGVGGLLGADRLLADIDAFTADHITTVTSKKLPVKKVISIADAYPMAFQQLRTRGVCRFPTEFASFDREHPGMYLCKLRNVELALVGITGSAIVAGSLRNVGVSKFRRADGSIVARTYPADVMPLSQYSIRGDALLFRFNPNDLKAFELNGIDTLWQLELPPGANRFDIGDLLDAQLVIYYDGYFSPALEAGVKASLPTTGASARSISLAMELPDELFYLKSNGNAEIAFTGAMFPSNQQRRRRTEVVLKLTGDAAMVGGLTLRLASAEHGEELVLTTSAGGEVEGIAPLYDEPLLDRWTVRITAEDNPRLVRGGRLDLAGLRDFLIFVEYTFDYR